MGRLSDRRTILMAVAAAAALGGGAGPARSGDLDVTIGFEGGGIIPKGRLAVYLDGGAGGQATSERTTLESGGGSTTASLSLPLPDTNMSAPRQIVAELQRPDGWLLARGSAQIEAGSPVVITLYTVMY